MTSKAKTRFGRIWFCFVAAESEKSLPFIIFIVMMHNKAIGDGLMSVTT